MYFRRNVVIVKELGTTSFLPQLIAKNIASSKTSQNAESLANSIENLRSSTVQLKKENKFEGTEYSQNSISCGTPNAALKTLSPTIDTDLSNSAFSNSIIATVESSEQDLRYYSFFYYSDHSVFL